MAQKKSFCEISADGWVESTYVLTCLITLWHSDPLLGNNGEISYYTTAVAR
jgi:hypothetical protein